MLDRFHYPGDDVLCKALGDALRQARMEAGLSVEQAEERLLSAMQNVDYRLTFRALGLAIRQARENRRMSRKELSLSAGVTVRKLITLERGSAIDLPVTDFFRISCALRMEPAQLSARCQQIEDNIVRGGSSER